MAFDYYMLQTRLKTLGYDPGPIDGIPGKMTDKALKAYAIDQLEALEHGGPAAIIRPASEDDPNTLKLCAELEIDEGFRNYVYKDSQGYETVGIGRLVDKRLVGKNGGITHDEALYLKMNDVRRVRKELDELMPWWRSLDPVRQRAVQNMAFQMGSHELYGTPTFALIREGKYAEAASRLRSWRWYDQTPERAERVIKQLVDGGE